MTSTKIKYIMKKKVSAEVRIKKLIYRKKTSFPYLSGDGFAQLCDAVYESPIGNKTNLHTAKSIFCHSDKLEQFISEYGDSISCHTLLVGNSDRDFYELCIELPSSIKRIFLQNSHISDSFIKTLPIGLENLRQGKNGLPKYFREDKSVTEKLNAILVGPFSPTHKEREELTSWEKIRSSQLHYLSSYIDTPRLAAISYKYKYVACPRGNGTDTHRFWETLYRGSIPVVKESQWSKSISKLGFPIMQLTEWSYDEFLEFSNFEDYQLFKPNLIASLWLQNWRLTIQSNPE